MRIRIAITAFFVAHAAFGGLCMMVPTAVAYDTDADHEAHEHWEMAMTSATPMSSVHCDGCVRVELAESIPMPAMGCVGGNCMMQASMTVVSAMDSSPYPVPSLLFKKFDVVSDAPKEQRYLSFNVGPPAHEEVKNVVLLL